jgi:hypothetical protein
MQYCFVHRNILLQRSNFSKYMDAEVAIKTWLTTMLGPGSFLRIVNHSFEHEDGVNKLLDFSKNLFICNELVYI